MNEKQLELVYEALRLIQRRSVDPKRTIEQRTSYQSAFDILRYALENNAECMYQFDDVELRCEDCARWEEDGSTPAGYYSLSMCNACENHEFFIPRR